MSKIFKRGESCPETGLWKCQETEEVTPLEKDDKFNGYYEKNHIDKNGC